MDPSSKGKRSRGEHISAKLEGGGSSASCEGEGSSENLGFVISNETNNRNLRGPSLPQSLPRTVPPSHNDTPSSQGKGTREAARGKTRDSEGKGTRSSAREVPLYGMAPVRGLARNNYPEETITSTQDLLCRFDQVDVCRQALSGVSLENEECMQLRVSLTRKVTL